MPGTAYAKLQTNPPTHYQRVTIIKAEKRVLAVGLKPIPSWHELKLQVCCQDQLRGVPVYYSHILNNDTYIRSKQEGFDPEREEKVKSCTCPTSQEVHLQVTAKVSVLLLTTPHSEPLEVGWFFSSNECQTNQRAGGTLAYFTPCNARR